MLGGGGGALRSGPRETIPDSDGIPASFFVSESKMSRLEPFLSAAI